MASIPTLEEIRAWIDTAEGQLSDEQLAVIIAAETADQSDRCRIPFDPDRFPAPLVAALYRRVARACILKGITVGVSVPAPGGQAVPNPSDLDAEIKRYERKFRRFSAG